MTLKKKLRGRWRLFMSRCPECNSVSIEQSTGCHTCEGTVCGNLPYFMKKHWWKRFITVEVY